MNQIRTKIGPSGRLVIPAEYRRALGIAVGDEVVLHLEDGELRILSVDRAIRRVQDAVRRYAKNDESLWSEKLTAERRAEAARENGDPRCLGAPGTGAGRDRCCARSGGSPGSSYVQRQPDRQSAG